MESVVENVNQWHMQSFGKGESPKSLKQGCSLHEQKCVKVNNFI